MRRGRVEVFKALFPDKHEGFANLFLEELDSWLSADIACCDSCYDEFVRRWPAIYLRDMEFQKSGIPLSCFYDGSALRELFSEEEFFHDVRQISCPKCGTPLTANIWPYSFPFKVPEGFEKIEEEIRQLAERTPFLVLSHSFSKKVLDEVHKIGSGTLPRKYSITYYRARRMTKLRPGESPSLGPPLPEKTPENRYNHAGRPALYIASDKNICYLELGEPSRGVHMAEIELLGSLRIMDLTAEHLESEVLNALVYSSLMSSASSHYGWYRPEYAFSRFVADCAVLAGVDGIKYPSVRSSVGHNVVIFRKNEDWGSVFRIKGIETYRPKQRQSKLRQ